MWPCFNPFSPVPTLHDTVGAKQVSIQEIRVGFEFVPGLFGMVLRGGYLYGAWPRKVQMIHFCSEGLEGIGRSQRELKHMRNSSNIIIIVIRVIIILIRHVIRVILVTLVILVIISS